MNEALFHLVNDNAGNVALIDNVARMLAVHGLTVLVVMIVALGLLQLKTDPRGGASLAVIAVAAIAIAGSVILVSGTLVTESRPFVGDTRTVLLIPHAADNSFPSHHAAMAGGLATLGGLAWRRWSLVFVAIAMAVGVARVYVGLHFPGDVLGGFGLGASAALLAWCAAGLTGLAPRHDAAVER